jgi:hypothetical protein
LTSLSKNSIKGYQHGDSEQMAYVARDRSGKQTEAYASVDEAIDAGVAAEMAGEIGSDWYIDEK